MSQALHQQEQNRLAKEAAARADAELNRVYKRLTTALTKKPTALAALKTAQNAWIAFRDAEAAAARTVFEGGTAEPQFVAGTLDHMTKERVTGLLLALAAATSPAGLLEPASDYAKADAMLNRVWQLASTDERPVAERVKAQRAWLKYREAEGALWSALGGNASSVKTRLTWERCGYFAP